MGEREIIVSYVPRKIFLPYHARTERFSVGVAHRRAGKTVAKINELIKRAILLDKPEGRYAYIAPLFGQAKDVAWTYLKRYAEPLLASPPSESELRVDLLNGARIRLYGADNPDRLRGLYLDGVVLDEFADMHPAIWGEVIRPALSDRQGWASFIGTPKGRNAFWEMYDRAKSDPEWFTYILRASETGILPQTELEAARRDMTPEQYEQEFECSFEAAILGAYFGREMADAERSGRIKPALPRIEGAPVHTAWDLGNGDHMAIWCFQVGAGEIRIIDFLQSYGYDMVKYCADLDARGYHGIDHVPHDARVKSMETSRTRIETLISLGRKPQLVPNHYEEDGINAARLTFPRCWFDADNCKDGLEALRQFRAEYDEKARTFKDTPKKDWAKHPADAFRYLCMGWREMVNEQPPPPVPPVKAITDYKVEEMWKFNKPRKERV